MGYEIEITRHDVSYYAADGEWLDGDWREIRPPADDSETFDPEWPEWDECTPVDWAVERIGRTDAIESSVDPVPAEVREHDWLAGTYTHPYDATVTETTVRLTGDWTPAQRSEVFRRVSAPR